jgi:hypothetical protein
MSKFCRRIRPYVKAELLASWAAEMQGHVKVSFSQLERAHVLGQASTLEHVRVHWHMFLWGLRQRKLGECAGQMLRIVGAASKTFIGLIPAGNTGGANVSPFRPMPVPPDLQALIEKAGS